MSSPSLLLFRLVGTFSTGLAITIGAQDVAEVSFIRAAHYEQASASEPVPVPQTPEQDPFYVFAVMAMSDEFLSDPDNLIFVRAVTMQPPTGQLRGLEFFDGWGGFGYYQAFTTAASLENAFRTGTYRFTFGSYITGDAVYDLVVPDRTLLSPAWVQNFAAAQRIDSSRDFLLQWTPASPEVGGVAVEVLEAASGGLVYDSGPQLGALSSWTIPAGILAEGVAYRAEITFTRLDVMDQSGFPYQTAASTVTTRLPLALGTGGEVKPSRFVSIQLNLQGELVFTIACTPATPLTLQKVTEMPGAWETVQTMTPTDSTATLTLPISSLGSAAFFRVMQ